MYRKGQHDVQGRDVPTIDFTTVTERDRAMQVLDLVERLGGPEALESLVDSERSGTVDLNEVTRRMRELRQKLQREHRQSEDEGGDD